MDDRINLMLGDCLERMKEIPDGSVDAVVCDPPYGLKFMGKDWDNGVPGAHYWEEVLRVAKPGAHLLAFGGTRTYHRLACAIEDAGWEIRDSIAWVYGSGFPKNMDVSKQMDLLEKNKWLNICKGVDNIDVPHIINEWSKYSKIAKSAGVSFRKNRIDAGIPTQKRNSVLGNALLLINQEKLNADVIIAELSLNEAQHYAKGNKHTVLKNAEAILTPLQNHAILAESLSENQKAWLSTSISTVQCAVRDWQSEKTEPITKGAEALAIWLGRTKCSNYQDTNALCAELTESLKLTILSRSKTFLNLDTKSQMDFVRATNAIITKYTAESLILFMAAIVRHKSLDKAEGAQREVIGIRKGTGSKVMCGQENGKGFGPAVEITTPVTDLAKQWDGWGTALKPALEPVVLARKPLEGTVANNITKYGVGGLNIDGCRVAATGESKARENEASKNTRYTENGSTNFAALPGVRGGDAKGRFPANLIHDGSDEVVSLFPNTKSGLMKAGTKRAAQDHPGSVVYGTYGGNAASVDTYADQGSAARFFYCAKASKRDRNDGCEHLDEKQSSHDGRKTPIENAFQRNATVNNNNHTTVKPTELMKYLCRLITPPNGVILDPFMGSGSTGKAAVLEGFRFIGIELDPGYFEIAKNRIYSAACKDLL